MSCWEANNSDERCTTGMALPDDVLQHILTFCSPLDVARLACVNARMRRVCASDAVWLRFFERHFMRANGFPSLAASKAGGWQKLYAAKKLACKKSEPFIVPAPQEISAALEHALPDPQAQASDVESIFLVDGSGSVTDEDFSQCRSVIEQVADRLEKLNGCNYVPTADSPTSERSSPDVSTSAMPKVKVALVQFSNEVKEEQSLTSSASSLRDAAKYMTRLNGGTSISQPLAAARDIFLSSTPPSSNGGVSPKRTVVLITDARLDVEQSNEALIHSQSLQSELATLIAFGIGRGADKLEMMRLLRGGSDVDDLADSHSMCRYLPLRTTPEALPSADR